MPGRRPQGWCFWVDRGGTFTDVIGRDPAGRLHIDKVLSAQPAGDAAVLGVRRMLGLEPDRPVPRGLIDEVKVGTTVATNALLERTGSPTALVITRGFADLLRIGHQTRPQLFALDIELPSPLYEAVVEIDERVDADGDVVLALDEVAASAALTEARQRGCTAAAIALLHSYRRAEHEDRVAELARDVGFEHVSTSVDVSPLMRLVSRGQTTVVDAYLSPTLAGYVADLTRELSPVTEPTRLRFMQSNGGVASADRFKGKDALLSGPAGGVVGMAVTNEAVGRRRLIGFDMGGTSTDVSHYAGAYERVDETVVADIPVQIPMLEIHTVAAGGGSIVHVEHDRLRVGPASAGAQPGPACYGHGGPATITDANVVLGRVRPDSFPAVFGSTGDQPLEPAASHEAFDRLAAELGDGWDASLVAAGALQVAVEHMAGAIKKISVERGHDLAEYTLACFGGAGGQHACAVADHLGIDEIVIHPLASVLSAFGIGLAAERTLRTHWVGRALDDDGLAAAHYAATDLARPQTGATTEIRLAVRYVGSDTVLPVPLGSADEVRRGFEDAHRRRFGFAPPAADLLIERVEAEVVVPPDLHADDINHVAGPSTPNTTTTRHPTWFDDDMVSAPFIDRDTMAEGEAVEGPAVILAATTSIVVESAWRAIGEPSGTIVMRRHRPRPERSAVSGALDPLQLELFDNRFMAVAEQMGTVLEQTAASVNIKERRDFSCAVFDGEGALIANAPHVPVHLGSMSAAVQRVAAAHRDHWRPGDTFATNAPYDGGTHLPDITVVRPVFDDGGRHRWFVAARGHHADVGGVSPGSFPARSHTIAEEGVVLDHVRVTHHDRFDDEAARRAFEQPPHPARAVDTNLADLRAQVAACLRGERELLSLADRHGSATVTAYMGHVQDNAEAAVRAAVTTMTAGSFVGEADDGSVIAIEVRPDPSTGSVEIDFGGTSAQHPGNLNAPTAVARAAVLYGFRCLIDSDIALNDGCFRPLRLLLPEASMVNPRPPGAVVAGNVETSQLIVDTLFGALGVLAASQGTMNNVVWGTDLFQYYETLCGGAGASASGPGASAVHTHMTNSRLTDPEVIEARFPVRIESFAVRTGSGGDGRHRGGDGVVRRVRFLEAMDLNLVTSRRRVAPHGLAGGRPGACGRNRLERADGSTLDLGGIAWVAVDTDDALVVETPGGGGYGTP
ncbi:MAG: hydantoinase B/oxoprolinase family protein [Acidimicrobiia bacterium]|nr:hydantoinase B/oxoprolinase family protein [Acidimicrobiia bacterium]